MLNNSLITESAQAEQFEAYESAMSTFKTMASHFVISPNFEPGDLEDIFLVLELLSVKLHELKGGSQC